MTIDRNILESGTKREAPKLEVLDCPLATVASPWIGDRGIAHLVRHAVNRQYRRPLRRSSSAVRLGFRPGRVPRGRVNISDLDALAVGKARAEVGDVCTDDYDLDARGLRWPRQVQQQSLPA